MSLSSKLYNTIFKRNSIYVASVFAGAYVFGVTFDIGIETFWDRWNRGKQWKDIRHKYIAQEE